MRVLIGRRSPDYEQFHPPLEIATRQEDSPAAGDALDADVGAEPHYSPIEAAAGVRLLEPHHVADGERNRFRIHHRPDPAAYCIAALRVLPTTSAREY
jgi:hypothetical protein